jgi:tRNA G10  N-methylase Trm11
MGNERFTVHVGDNLPILKTLPDNSVDAIVTDPPYGLNDGTETLQDVFFAKFFNVFFPQFNKLIPGLLNQSQFTLPPERISLLDLMNRAIDIHSRVGVPEGSVDFNDCIVGWNEKIKDAYESPFTVPHGMLSNEIDLQLGEEAFDFTLQLRRCFNATLGDSATIGITECGSDR